MNKIRFALAAGVLALAGTTSAHAGSDIGWSISIGSSGPYHHHYAPRIVYEPRVVYAPAPIYFHYYDAPRRHYRPHSYYGGHGGHGHYKHHGHGRGHGHRH
ncbi:MAG TPA: hypothetical protein VFF75_00180 [Methylophilaceae bacterium]|nr:hypothetical protein [Methylophilaceae bacterium]